MRVTLLLSGLLFLTGCLLLDTTLLTATATPTDAATPTPTVVWFPPSATPTLLAIPTRTATPEMSPGIGKVILTDDFSDESVWDTATSDNGSAAVGRHFLTLAVEPGYYLSSMRRETPLSDFYAEITARPSLCRGEDNYGMIIRGVGSSFYRFVLTCNRQVRAERVNGGTKLPLQQPVASGDAPGAPGDVHIGIWAVGSEMRLFLNGRYQFNISDSTYKAGEVGVFVRSAGETPVTVTFSDLSVYDVTYSPSTATPRP